MEQTPSVNESLSSSDIETTTDLLRAPFEEVEYGRVHLSSKSDRGDRSLEGGRVINRTETIITVKLRGHTHDIDLSEDWTLTEWCPIRSPIERQQIEQEWAE